MPLQVTVNHLINPIFHAVKKYLNVSKAQFRWSGGEFDAILRDCKPIFRIMKMSARVTTKVKK